MTQSQTNPFTQSMQDDACYACPRNATELEAERAIEFLQIAIRGARAGNQAAENSVVAAAKALFPDQFAGVGEWIFRGENA